MKRDPRDWALVSAQGIALAALATPGRPRWGLPRPIQAGAGAAAAGGAVLAAAAMARLGSRLSVFPTPSQDARLRTTGAFGITRHPIYTGSIAAAGGVALLRRRPEPLLALAALVAVFNVKVRYEERLLAARFGSAYGEYTARVPRLLPRLPRVRPRLQVEEAVQPDGKPGPPSDGPHRE